MSLLDRSLGEHHGERGAGVTKRTFAVSDVVPATEPLQLVPYHQAVSEFLGGKIESCSKYHGKLIAGLQTRTYGRSVYQVHPLIGALHTAFATHRPICLTPDIIWLTLTQGLSHHVNANAEQLRHHFVRHEGKLEIRVRRDDFIKGSPENPWPEVFSEFSAAVRNHIGDAHDLIVADFSTTGPVERAACEIVMLEAMQSYFSYAFETSCGIPTVTLEGTPADWKSIAHRARQFQQYGLEWWVTALMPILEQFVAAANGTIDRTFWDSMYKWDGAAGSGKNPHVSGWILKLFPYLNPIADDDSFSPKSLSYCRNHWIDQPPARGVGPGLERFPSLPARVPFEWKYLDTRYAMEFVGGLVGISQDPHTLCLRPEIGWAVMDAGAKQRKDQADADAIAKQREAAEKASAAERAKTEVVAPHIATDQPRHSQFFQFVCPFCNHSEQVGLWFTFKICTGCKKGWRIVRPTDREN